MSEIASERQNALKSIVERQMELLRLSLFVATQGPTVYQGETLRCTLSEAKLKTSQQIAMAAGQSVHTILKCAEWRGIPVRDLYPIARSAVESFINAAFLLIEDESAAERAVRWVKYRAWKEVNREVGSGEFKLRLSSSQGEQSPLAEFLEFTAKGASREWSALDAPSRIRRVGEIVGKKAGSRLLGAYALIYSVSSEIIHGSPFGVNFFYQAHMPPSGTVDGFREATGKQVEGILIAVAHAAAGYLAAFFRSMQMSAPYETEQELFNQLLALEGVEPQQVE
ncbi:MAG: hypothetical protein HY018_12340 [Hydrogenophilales bacterium]|nr:hypothetical protein [Hydrogenophilales bacterium]